MNLFKSFLIVILFSLSACNKESKELYKGDVVLVAYEINHPSRIWVKEINSDKVHEIIISKYRREPDINLKDTIEITFFKDTCIKVSCENIFNKIPNDSINKIVSLENYYKVYNK